MFKRILFTSVLIIIILLVFVTLSASAKSAKTQDLKIIHENRKFYVLFPDSNKVEIVNDHEGGADNMAILSPDFKYVFYTDITGIGFESSGKDMFSCKPDGTERTFLHKLGGDVEHASWIKKKGRNYLLFLEVYAEAGNANIDLFDFDNRIMLLKIEGWVLEPTKRGDCFIIGKEPWKPEEWSEICLDSLLALSNPEKYDLEVYTGYGEPNLLFLSTRKEAFYNPESFWRDTPDEKISKMFYGGLGQCFPSLHKRRSVYCIKLDTESWVGVLNNKTGNFQFMDSISAGEYKYNFAWSDNDNFLGFVKKYPDNSQEIVVLEFTGDLGYTIKNKIEFKGEKDVELIGWSALKGGFEYMIGEKELLKIKE